MKNTSTGFGLALLAGAILAFPIVSNISSRADASAVTVAASVVSTAATAQTEPTIVWYGVSGDQFDQTIIRAWSDGRVEATAGSWRVDQAGQCAYWKSTIPGGSAPWCGSRWNLVSDPAQGLSYRSDLNHDEKVDGADLGQLLVDWGNAPRQEIPPSGCPLALINP